MELALLEIRLFDSRGFARNVGPGDENTRLWVRVTGLDWLGESQGEIPFAVWTSLQRQLREDGVDHRVLGQRPTVRTRSTVEYFDLRKDAGWTVRTQRVDICECGPLLIVEALAAPRAHPVDEVAPKPGLEISKPFVPAIDHVVEACASSPVADYVKLASARGEARLREWSASARTTTTQALVGVARHNPQDADRCHAELIRLLAALELVDRNSAHGSLTSTIADLRAEIVSASQTISTAATVRLLALAETEADRSRNTQHLIAIVAGALAVPAILISLWGAGVATPRGTEPWKSVGAFFLVTGVATLAALLGLGMSRHRETRDSAPQELALAVTIVGLVFGVTFLVRS